MTWPGAPTFRSRRCKVCDINWPRSTGFDQCPGCDNFTETSTCAPIEDGPAADLADFLRQQRMTAEYQSKLKHEEFEAYADGLLIAELAAELDQLPTADVEEPRVHWGPRTTPNFGRAGGQLGC